MSQPQSPFSGETSRDAFITIVQTALQAGEHRFARRAALQWLSQYPGDLEVALLQVKAFHAGGGQHGIVQGQLHQLTLKDPNFIQAYQFGYDLWKARPNSAGKYFVNGLYAVGGMQDTSAVAEWALALQDAAALLSAGDLENAEAALLPAIAEDPPTPLLAIIHIKLVKEQSRLEQQQNNLVSLKILEHYAFRWETCLPIRLALAEALLQGADPDRGVAYLHSTMAEDIAGQVVKHIYGAAHPFTEMWPVKITGHLDLSLPASIAGIFGWNRIGSGVQSYTTENARPETASDALYPPIQDLARGKLPHQQPQEKSSPNSPASPIFDPQMTPNAGLPETLVSTRTTLEKMAQKIDRPELMQSEGRFPVYVILSTKNLLRKKYGEQGSEQIINAMRQLQWTLKQRPGWSSVLLMVDDPQSVATVPVRPIVGDDAWAIKKLLAEVDDQFARRGEMIGALLIIGGPDIVPFHHLPNPVDDLDVDVPSDNPYATMDENYFVPEWPVGRLPGDASANPHHLIRSINQLVNRHSSREQRLGWLQRMVARIKGWFRQAELKSNYGYTAAIWSRAAAAVYQPLGNAASLLVSPPSTYQEYRQSKLSGTLGYFNLHGIQDSSEWFGHMDPTQPSEGQDYPVALRPADVTSSARIPAVVFSEACFGANIIGKKENESIPLRFLSNGTACFIGSTCTAYGAVTTPLIAADYLAYCFWKHTRQGSPVGEALKRAKIDLIQEMDRRQGYLDGEDQKTLISFNLFGDPLYLPGHSQPISKEILRPLEKPSVHPVNEKQRDPLEQPISEETVYIVKKLVREYLPGLENGRVNVRPLSSSPTDGGRNPVLAVQKSAGPEVTLSQHQVVTISKSIQRRRKTHHQYARLTVDQQGKVVKISVSR